MVKSPDLHASTDPGSGRSFNCLRGVPAIGLRLYTTEGISIQSLRALWQHVIARARKTSGTQGTDLFSFVRMITRSFSTNEIVLASIL